MLITGELPPGPSFAANIAVVVATASNPVGQFIQLLGQNTSRSIFCPLYVTVVVLQGYVLAQPGQTAFISTQLDEGEGGGGAGAGAGVEPSAAQRLFSHFLYPEGQSEHDFPGFI